MKTLSLQKILHWAFVDELVKGGGEDGLNSPFSAWRSFDAVAQLGVRVDRDRASCDMPMMIEQGEPHPDALLVGEAVRSVVDVDYQIAPLDALLSDWPELERSLATPFYEEVMKRLQSRTQKEIGKSIIAQIVSNAVLCKTPCYAAPLPKVDLSKKAGKPCWFIKKMMVNDLGREVETEVDGYNKKSGRPISGAYRKYVLTHNPQGDIMARIDYQFWVQALSYIFFKLNGNMQNHQLSPITIKISPWMQKKFNKEINCLTAISA